MDIHKEPEYTDDIARFNAEAWEGLAKARNQYTVPWLDLDADTARRRVDPDGLMGDVKGKDILCLAGGGGQQSAVFGLLGARVTVLDLSTTQLERDRQTAEHYGLAVTLVRGDMRDLSAFGDGAFDLVYHAHAINFVPDPLPVFDEVARVLCPDGLYRVSCANPFVHGVWEDSWDGGGYRLRRLYVDGGEVTYEDPHWEFNSDDGTRKKALGAREFRHSLSTLINGMIARRLQIFHIREWPTGDAGAEPGSFGHLAAHAPPWLTIWARRTA